jgi:hypothetical protein
MARPSPTVVKRLHHAGAGARLFERTLSEIGAQTRCKSAAGRARLQRADFPSRDLRANCGRTRRLRALTYIAGN